MADRPPLLFGKPGKFEDDTWSWVFTPVSVVLVQTFDDEWEATVWIDGNHSHCGVRETWQLAMAEAESELTRLARALDAMGVPRG